MLCNILEEIDLTNNGGKVNPEGNAENNASTKENDCEDGKVAFYLTNPIKKFITTVIKKQNTTDRSVTKAILNSLLSQNVYHKKLYAFVHDWAEAVQVVFYELGIKKWMGY